MPKISFVLPTYNRIAWLAPAINSLRGQTEADIEIVIVDDGSTDGSRELLEWFKVQDSRIKVIYNETNMGAGKSRNIGCDAATAEIIGVCDSDDVYVETRAKETLDWFERNPDSELVNFPYVTIDYFEDVVDVQNGLPFNHEAFKKDGSISYYCNPAAAYKKTSALEIGGYPNERMKDEDGEKITDDYQFIKNWVDSGKKVDFCEANLKGEIPYVTMHRILPDSMMSKLRGFDPKWIKAA